jgi:hypothetical protein
MRIEQDQVASIEPFGMLDGKPVKLVQLKGGLNLATSEDKNGVEQVLGASSHRAILSYTIEQRHSGFQPMIMKSEVNRLSAENHSHFLSDNLRKSGHDIYSIQDGSKVEFYLTKQNVKVGGASGSIQDNCMIIDSLNIPKEAVNAVSSAVSEKSLSIGLESIKVK